LPKKGTESLVDIHIRVPSSLRNKIYNYLDKEGGNLTDFYRGLTENFFENEEWLKKHKVGNRRRYWDKQL